MAIEVRCSNPECGKTLTVRDEFAGKVGKCPSCGSTVKIPARAENEPEELPTVRQKKESQEAPDSPTRARRSDDEDEDDDRRPARRRRDDDDDVRRSSRRRRDEDEDADERRPVRRRRDEDEEDDDDRVPARRRRDRDEDDDDDYEPSPRKKKQRQATATGIIACLGVAIGLLLFLGFTPLFSMFTVSVSAAGQATQTKAASGMIGLTEGMLLMVFTLLVAAGVIAALVLLLTISKDVADVFVTIASAVAAGWGLTAAIWLLAFIWDLFAAASFVKSNMVGPIEVSITPGIGLWIGLGLAIGVVACVSTLVTLGRKSIWLYVGEGAGLLLGALLLCVNVQPWWQGDASAKNPFAAKIKFSERYDRLDPDKSAGR
jgi:hypothetical protein